jgi:hypothetical protein
VKRRNRARRRKAQVGIRALPHALTFPSEAEARDDPGAADRASRPHSGTMRTAPFAALVVMAA